MCIILWIKRLPRSPLINLLIYLIPETLHIYLYTYILLYQTTDLLYWETHNITMNHYNLSNQELFQQHRHTHMESVRRHFVMNTDLEHTVILSHTSIH